MRRARLFYNGVDEDAAQTASEIVEEGRDRVYTGLLDASGDPIYREPKRLQVGFRLKHQA